MSQCVSKSVKFLIFIHAFIKGKEPTKYGGVDKRWEKLEMEKLDGGKMVDYNYRGLATPRKPWLLIRNYHCWFCEHE